MNMTQLTHTYKLRRSDNFNLQSEVPNTAFRADV